MWGPDSRGLIKNELDGVDTGLSKAKASMWALRSNAQYASRSCVCPVLTGWKFATGHVERRKKSFNRRIHRSTSGSGKRYPEWIEWSTPDPSWMVTRPTKWSKKYEAQINNPISYTSTEHRNELFSFHTTWKPAWFNQQFQVSQLSTSLYLWKFTWHWWQQVANLACAEAKHILPWCVHRLYHLPMPRIHGVDETQPNWGGGRSVCR